MSQPLAENHAHAVALHFAYYNFVIVHSAPRISVVGISKKLRRTADLVGGVEAAKGQPMKSGLYAKVAI